jgi:predicted ester cyclase
LVRELIERHQSGGDDQVFDEIVSEDFVDRTAPRPEDASKAAARRYFAMLRAAFPDLHVQVHDQAASGDKIWTRKTFHGTHLGSYGDIAASGRRVTWGCIDVVRFSGGKLVEHWGIEDLPGLISQLRGTS